MSDQWKMIRKAENKTNEWAHIADVKLIARVVPTASASEGVVEGRSRRGRSM